MYKKLNRKNFIDQITRYGYFAEQFPDCFSSESFADNLDELLPLIPIGKAQKTKVKNITAPTTLSTYKNDISRRVLSVSNPEAFCNTDDKEILAQVLNDYDQETIDFYRWKVSYTTKQLSSLIRKKSGIDFGKILSLEPIKRGVSGRIYCRIYVDLDPGRT